MAGPRHCPSGLLLAATLGGVVLGAPPPLLAQAAAAGRGRDGEWHREAAGNCTRLRRPAAHVAAGAPGGGQAARRQRGRGDCGHRSMTECCVRRGAEEGLAAAAAAVCVIALLAIRRTTCLQS